MGRTAPPSALRSPHRVPPRAAARPLDMLVQIQTRPKHRGVALRLHRLTQLQQCLPQMAHGNPAHPLFPPPALPPSAPPAPLEKRFCSSSCSDCSSRFGSMSGASCCSTRGWHWVKMSSRWRASGRWFCANCAAFSRMRITPEESRTCTTVRRAMSLRLYPHPSPPCEQRGCRGRLVCLPIGEGRRIGKSPATP
jgi:hypothetical protein